MRIDILLFSKRARLVVKEGAGEVYKFGSLVGWDGCKFLWGGGLYLDGGSESKMEYCWICEWGLSCLASRANPSLFHRTQSVQPYREYFTKIYPVPMSSSRPS